MCIHCECTSLNKGNAMKLTKKEDVLFSNLHFAAQAVAKNDVRNDLSVLHVRTLNGNSYAIGTDGFRMHWAQCDLEPGAYAVEKATKTILILDRNGESAFNYGDDLAKRAMLLDSTMKFHCSEVITTILRLWVLQENPAAVTKQSITYNPDYLAPVIGLDFIDFDSGAAYFTDGILHALVMPRKVI